MLRRLTLAGRRAGLGILVLLCLYLIGRAVVEVATVDPTDHASYHEDWGGPSYVGVLAVHCLPGIAAVVFLVWLTRQLRKRRRLLTDH